MDGMRLVIICILVVLIIQGFRHTSSLEKQRAKRKALRDEALGQSKNPETPVVVLMLDDGNVIFYKNGKRVKIPSKRPHIFCLRKSNPDADWDFALLITEPSPEP